MWCLRVTGLLKNTVEVLRMSSENEHDESDRINEVYSS